MCLRTDNQAAVAESVSEVLGKSKFKFEDEDFWDRKADGH